MQLNYPEQLFLFGTHIVTEYISMEWYTLDSAAVRKLYVYTFRFHVVKVKIQSQVVKELYIPVYHDGRCKQKTKIIPLILRFIANRVLNFPGLALYFVRPKYKFFRANLLEPSEP